jgi:hypothetical protein
MTHPNTEKTMRFAYDRVLFKFYPETEAAVPAPSFKQVSNHFFLMGCHAGGTPIVNGVKKCTPLPRGGSKKMNTKKRGGRGGGVDVSIRHSTPPPSLGLGRGGGGEIHRGSNFLCSVFFCDNMLFFEFEKKKKNRSYIPQA